MREEIQVRYVELPDMTVASVLGFGEEPENQASMMMSEFGRKHGLKPGSPEHPMYGFNNPNPSPGSENYGYELWCRVDVNTTADAPVKIKRIPGARYAVTRFTGLSNIGGVWRQLAAWVDDHHGTIPPCTIQCWLESLQTPDEPDPEKWVMDLYLMVGS